MMMSALGWTAVIGVAAVISLIAFLVTKEVAGARLSPSPEHTTRLLNITIVPMTMVFAFLVAVKIAVVLA